MGENSNRNSGSGQKGFLKRMLGQDKDSTAKQTKVKQKYLGFALSDYNVFMSGRTAKPKETISSQAIKNLNRDGYTVYNTPEEEDIYVTMQSESAFFDEDEPEMVRMTGDDFVSARKEPRPSEITVKRTEPVFEHIVFEQPADIFTNASRRAEYEEVDFDEVIIKSNDSFEEELEKAPLFAFDIEETAESDIASILIEPENALSEIPEYSVVADDEPEGKYSQKIRIPSEIRTDMIPAGLYVENSMPTDVARVEDIGMSILSFEGISAEAESAMTSASASPLADPIFSMVADNDYLCIPKAREIIAEETICEITSSTVVGYKIHTITDPVGDIMKLTIPKLEISEEMMSWYPSDKELSIPDDGLEAYDSKFVMAERCVSKTASTGTSFEYGNAMTLTDQDNAVIFRF